jgi:hypothetical protein
LLENKTSISEFKFSFLTLTLNISTSICCGLGVTFTHTGSIYRDISNKIAKGKKAIQLLNSILWSKKVQKKSKKMLYSTAIESIGLYGAEI